MAMSDTKARETILKGGRTSEALYDVAYGLDRNGSDILGVPAAVISDILGLSWPTERGNSSGNEYGPTVAHRVDDTSWSRTFLPQDIEADQEASLSALANTTQDLEVKARLYDVLYERFKKRDYAREALMALCDCAAAYTDAEHWVVIHDWSARAVFLSGRLGDASRSRAALDALSAAASRVLSGRHKFAFAAFADLLSGDSAKHLRAPGLLFNADLRRWAETLNLVAIHYRLKREWSYVEQLRESQARVWKLAGNPGAQTWTFRTLVEEYLLESEEHDEVATVRLQSAMGLAASRGFKDLLALAKKRLAPAIERETARMKGHTVTLRIEQETVSALNDILGRSRAPSEALRALAATPLFTLLPVDKAIEATKRELASSPFYAMVTSTTFRNSNISHVAVGGTGDKIKAHLTHVLSMQLAKIDRLAGHSVTVLFGKGVSSGTLDDALLTPTWMRPARREQLGEASRHFARQDWYAAGSMLALSYEGVLRDWLRANDYPAVKYNSDGTTSDEMLNSLARNPVVEALLDRDYLAMVRYLLCDPEMGLNLRNEVAHANARPRSFTPGLVLLIALAIIRLTLLLSIRATEDDEAAPSDATAGDEGAMDSVADDGDDGDKPDKVLVADDSDGPVRDVT